MEALSNSPFNYGVFDPLFCELSTFKHPCYINEREKRIVILDSTPRATDSKYRVSNGINIPYLEISLPLSTIKEIIIGPCANKELNAFSIQMQIDSITSLPKDISIDFSDLPYRQV